jgi:hypothetical protein
MQLGRINKLNPREVWPHEALDFTRWLAREENINILCEELQINICNVRAEASAGRFNVDIVGDDVDTGKKVVIENQLESTDHKHLGQLLTYASAYDACVIVWIVSDYSEEHRQAIDWFNKNMPDAISFFLVQIEVYRIGDSDPAPKFNIISEPNNWSKVIKQSSAGDSVSDLKLLQQEFWQELKSFAAAANTELNIGRSPRPQHWYNIAMGTSRCHLALTLNTQKGYIGCEVYIRNDPELYATFSAKKEQIEADVGAKLEWMELPNATASRIQLTFTGDPRDRAKWSEYHSWCLDTAYKFSVAFRPHV